MLSQKLVSIFKSKQFKVFTTAMGIAFLAATILISLDYRPFARFGYFGVFMYNLFGIGTLIVPVLARHMNIYMLAAVSALGNTLNDSVSYLVGKNIDDLTEDPPYTKKVAQYLAKYGVVFLFIFSAIPFPYDFIGGIVGYLKYPYKKFMAATFFGKFVRFVLLGFGVVSIWGRL